MITKSLLLERISPMALSRGLLFTLIMATNTRAFAEAPVRDLLSLSLEELMTLEVDTRQPYRNQVTGENLPLAMEVLDEELLQRLDAHSLQDALDYTGGVVRQNSFGNTWDSFAIRGFAGDENLPGGYFVNGFSAGRGFSGLRDLANIERIEVLKGAGAALYGRNEPGGTINLVTKKPKFEPEAYLQMALGSYDTRRLEGDYSRGLNTQVALRINGAYEEGESFRATPGVKKLSLNPSLLYRISDQTHISYEMEILDQELPFDRGVVVLDGKFSQVPVTRFYGEPADGPMKIIARGHQLTFEQQLTANWSLLAGLGYRSSSLEGYSTEPELTPSRQLLFSDGVTLNRQRRYRNFDATDLSGRVELSGKFELLGLPQQLLLGLDNYHYQLNQIQNVWRVTPGDSTYSVNLQQPVYGQPQPALNPFWDLREREQSTGFYLQNQSDLGERWRLMAGFRYDSPDRQFDNFLAATRARQEYHKFTPHLGLVFIAAPQLSIYANYSEGFRPNTGTNWQGEAFAPETSRSYELGAHFNVLDNALKGGLSIFNAEKSNILTADTLNYGYSLALGKAESRGLEVNLEAALAKTWRVVFAYDYVDAQTANDMINPDWGVAIPKGSRLLNIPKHKASLVLQRKFTWRGQPLATGLGAIYVGERLGETVDPDFILPGYTSLRLFANYNLDKKLQLSLVVDNLLNEGYYANSYSALWAQPGNERSLRLGLKGKF